VVTNLTKDDDDDTIRHNMNMFIVSTGSYISTCEGNKALTDVIGEKLEREHIC